MPIAVGFFKEMGQKFTQNELTYFTKGQIEGMNIFNEKVVEKEEIFVQEKEEIVKF